MANLNQPQWQPISVLPLITEVIDDLLLSAKDQYNLLFQAKDKPHILDQPTVTRVIQVYSQQKEDIWLYEEQLKRWQNQKLTSKQQTEVTKLQRDVEEFSNILNDILALADDLKKGTIETILGKSDLEILISRSGDNFF